MLAKNKKFMRLRSDELPIDGVASELASLPQWCDEFSKLNTDFQIRRLKAY